MQSKSIMESEVSGVQSRLDDYKREGFTPNLAIVFLPANTDFKPIQQLLAQRGIAIFGTHTPGSFSDQSTETGQIQILLLEAPPASFKIVLQETNDTSEYSTEEEAERIGHLGKKTFQNPAYIITAPDIQKINGGKVLQGLAKAVGTESPIIGGMAGGSPILENCVVFTMNESSTQAILCLIIDQDKIKVEGVAVSGWKPAGAPKIITKSEGKWVYTIDDKPALDQLLKFTGLSIDMDKVEDLFTHLGTAYPLQMIRADGSSIMNPPLLFNRETKAVQCGMIIKQGSKIRFSLPPDLDILETVVDSAQSIKAEKLPEADAMIIFSCIGRLNNMGPLVDDELKGLQKVWDVPMTGFYSLGEFGTPAGSHVDFHGTTISWVALKERKSN